MEPLHVFYEIILFGLLGVLCLWLDNFSFWKCDSDFMLLTSYDWHDFFLTLYDDFKFDQVFYNLSFWTFGIFFGLLSHKQLGILSCSACHLQVMTWLNCFLS